MSKTPVKCPTPRLCGVKYGHDSIDACKTLSSKGGQHLVGRFAPGMKKAPSEDYDSAEKAALMVDVAAALRDTGNTHRAELVERDILRGQWDLSPTARDLEAAAADATDNESKKRLLAARKSVQQIMTPPELLKHTHESTMQGVLEVAVMVQGLKGTADNPELLDSVRRELQDTQEASRDCITYQDAKAILGQLERLEQRGCSTQFTRSFAQIIADDIELPGTYKGMRHFTGVPTRPLEPEEVKAMVKESNKAVKSLVRKSVMKRLPRSVKSPLLDPKDGSVTNGDLARAIHERAVLAGGDSNEKSAAVFGKLMDAEERLVASLERREQYEYYIDRQQDTARVAGDILRSIREGHTHARGYDDIDFIIDKLDEQGHNTGADAALESSRQAQRITEALGTLKNIASVEPAHLRLLENCVRDLQGTISAVQSGRKV